MQAPRSDIPLASCRRNVQEARAISKNPPEGVTLAPDENNMQLWRCVVDGPDDTPYAGGKFRIDFRVPSDYPLNPPPATFKTRIFHPNVHFKTGEVCMDILKTAWTPAWTLLSVAQAVWSILAEPNADSPLNCDAGNLIRCNDHKGYYSIARMYTVEHALP